MGIQPVVMMTTAATNAANDPRRSPATCKGGGPNVEVLAVSALQHPERQDIDRKARQRDPEHHAGEHGGWLAQALPGFGDDPGRDDEQRQPVDEGYDDGKPIVTVGPLPIRRASGQAKPVPGERETCEIRHHVPGIGEERERA
jgi:hypothetical protein